jgi:DNA-binding XRE family transcriptional regulator
MTHWKPGPEWPSTDSLAGEETMIPLEVLKSMVDYGWTPVRAWREYLGLSQAIVAKRLGISQLAYAAHESNHGLNQALLIEIAAALRIQLRWLYI